MMDFDERAFLEQYLPAWEKFLDTYRNTDDLENFSRENVKNAFEVANNLEHILRAGEAHSSVLGVKLEGEGKMLADLTVDKGRKACDTLLTKFLLAQSKKTSSREWAVDEYVDVCGKERLRCLVESLLRAEMSCKVVLQYLRQRAATDSSSKFASELGLRVVAAELKMLAQESDVKGISEVVAVLLSDRGGLSRVLELLLLGDDAVWDEVRPAIVETLVKHVEDDAALWRELAATVDGGVVAKVCAGSPSFLAAVLRKVVCSGARLQCKYCQETRSHRWAAPEDDAPVLQFSQLVGLMRCLLASGGAVAQQTFASIHALTTKDGAAVWEELLAAASQ